METLSDFQWENIRVTYGLHTGFKNGHLYWVVDTESYCPDFVVNGCKNIISEWHSGKRFLLAKIGDLALVPSLEKRFRRVNKDTATTSALILDEGIKMSYCPARPSHRAWSALQLISAFCISQQACTLLFIVTAFLRLAKSLTVLVEVRSLIVGADPPSLLIISTYFREQAQQQLQQQYEAENHTRAWRHYSRLAHRLTNFASK